MKILFFTFCILTFSIQAQAQFTFSYGLSISQKDSDDFAYTTTSRKALLNDAHFGYFWPSGFFLGGVYNAVDYKDTIDLPFGVPDSTTVHNKGKAFGLAVGYRLDSGLYGRFNYYLTADLGDQQDGAGWQLDFGWFIPITSSMGIGPQMSYRDITYNKIDNGTAIIDDKNSYVEYAPYITFWITFGGGDKYDDI